MDKKNKDLIKEKINLIENNLILLNECYIDFNNEKNSNKKIFLKHALAKFIEEIIEFAIKINNEILKSNKDYANNYYQTFIKLKDYFDLKKIF